MEKTWVMLEGQRRNVQRGMQLKELLANAGSTDSGGENPVALGVVNGRRVCLNEPLWGEEHIELLRLNDPEAHSTTSRTLCTVLTVACEEIFPRHPLTIDFGYGGGMYCSLQREEPLIAAEVRTLADRMQEIIKRDLVLTPRLYSQQALARILGDSPHRHTRLAVRHVRLEHTPLYRVEGSSQIFHGLHLPSTGYLRAFSIELESPGLILRLSSPGKPAEILPHTQQPKLLDAMRSYSAWTSEQGMANLGSINRFVEEGRVKELIRVCEARHDQIVVKSADRVAELPSDGRLVLVAGPSSSGKTSFAKRLALQLRVQGLKPFALSLDNYFIDRDDTPLDENGDFDFESLAALKLDLFNDHLTRLLAGEAVRLPRFDFAAGRGTLDETPTEVMRGAPLIVEGIHALNPEIGKNIPHANTVRVYVSALCHTNIDNGTYIPTTLSRLYRRIVRDAQFRGYTAGETLTRWPSVRAGEERNIFPFQQNADLFFNSGLAYELGVLKLWAEPRLAAVPPEDPNFGPASSLLELLAMHLPIDARLVPPTSLLREFIGESGFSY